MTKKQAFLLLQMTEFAHMYCLFLSNIDFACASVGVSDFSWAIHGTGT